MAYLHGLLLWRCAALMDLDPCLALVLIQVVYYRLQLDLAKFLIFVTASTDTFRR